MIGLPYLETVAASTGRIVAMVSPGETQTHGNFAWARTLKHEMIHVFNLQQTGYNIPHWFTEGLAVYSREDSAALSLDAVAAAAGGGRDLDESGNGERRFRPGDGAATSASWPIARASCMSSTCSRWAAAMRPGRWWRPTRRIPRRTRPSARCSAFRRRNSSAATRPFSASRSTPRPCWRRRRANDCASLASLKLKAEKYDEAAELYAQGERLDPANPQWTAGRAGLSGGGSEAESRPALARFAQIEPDDLPSRKKLAELALERREPAVARRWATEALEIQVEDAEAHRLLAAALVELNELDGAIEEFEAAIETQSGPSSAALCPGRRPASGPAAGQGEKSPGRIAPPRPQIPRGRHPAGKPGEEALEWRRGTSNMTDTPPAKQVSLSDFQLLIRRMYHEKDVARGVEGTFMWLMEEVGELATALRNGSHEERVGEFADVLAWLTTIANVVGVDLTQAVLQKYGAGCPGCGRFVCTCPDAGKP